MKNARNARLILPMVLLMVATSICAQKNEKIIAAITKIETDWHQAYVIHDAKVLREILSEDFILVGPKGGRIGKEAVIKNLTEDKSTYEYSTPYDLEFRVYPGCVILLGKTKEKGIADGVAFEAKYFWKDIFIKMKGKWECVLASTAKIEG